MRIDILTLFPKMFIGPFEESIIKRAQEKGLVKLKIHNLRDWAQDRHKTVDDRPFGGGTGMILMVEPVDRAIKDLKTEKPASPAGRLKDKKTKVILLDPAGKKFDQRLAGKLAKEKHLILIAGHYEGVDERVREHLVDEAISIGDYVLTGGELPAMVVVDAIVRLIPGVLEKPEATKNESFSPITNHPSISLGINHSLITVLEYPQYTRPKEYRDWKVPEVLLSGDHKKIAEWRKKQAEERTRKRRPDLIKRGGRKIRR